jgi:hypothetical protein
VGNGREGRPCVKVEIEGETTEVNYRDMALIPLALDETKEVTIFPAKQFDVGEGKGKQLKVSVEGGVVGLIIDARGRPLGISDDDEKRIALLKNWNTALGIYPEEENSSH